jgi:lipoate-protein ligase A
MAIETCFAPVRHSTMPPNRDTTATLPEIGDRIGVTSLIVSDDLDATTNMALDEVLWGEASSGANFLRIYRWANRPVLSLGYFQDSDAVRCDPLLRGLPYVRRLTGGGAVVHDDEITYSLALAGPVAPQTDALYRRVHCGIAASLRAAGVPAAVGARGATGRCGDDLCFARDDRHAVRLQGCKVLGSAQRRRPYAVLMHGSLILSRSPATPQVQGVYDLLHDCPDREELRRAVVRGIESSLGLQLSPLELPSELGERAAALARSKYATAEWNDRRRSGD